MSKKEKARRAKLREDVRVYGHTAFAMYAIGNNKMGDAYKVLARKASKELLQLEDTEKWYWDKYFPTLYPDAVELQV